jgi:hypothetical protein
MDLIAGRRAVGYTGYRYILGKNFLKTHARARDPHPG